MRETDRDFDSVESLDWGRIRTKFMENTDPDAGGHPIDDPDIRAKYIKFRDIAFDVIKEVLVELKYKKSLTLSSDAIIFLSGYTLGRVLNRTSDRGVISFTNDMVSFLRKSFTSRSIYFECDMSQKMVTDLRSCRLTLEELLNNKPELLAGFFTSFALEIIG